MHRKLLFVPLALLLCFLVSSAAAPGTLRRMDGNHAFYLPYISELVDSLSDGRITNSALSTLVPDPDRDRYYGADTLSLSAQRVLFAMDQNLPALSDGTQLARVRLDPAISRADWQSLTAILSANNPLNAMAGTDDYFALNFAWRPDTMNALERADRFYDAPAALRQRITDPLDRLALKTDEILSAMPDQLTPAQQCRYFCVTLAEIADPPPSDLSFLPETIHGVELHNPIKNPDGALLNGVADCVGYAKAFQLLTQKVGIQTITVSGQSEHGVGHMWCMTRLGGVWYHVDPIWFDSQISGLYNEECLLAGDESFRTVSIHLPKSDSTCDAYRYTETLPAPAAPRDYPRSALQ